MSVPAGMTTVDERALTQIAGHEIATQADFALACRALRVLAERVKRIEADTEPEIQQAYRLHRALVAARKLELDRWTTLADVIRTAVAKWRDEHASDVPAVEGIGYRDQLEVQVTDLRALVAHLLAQDGDLLSRVVKIDSRELIARARRAGALFSMPGVHVGHRSVVAVFGDRKDEVTR